MMDWSEIQKRREQLAQGKRFEDAIHGGIPGRS